MTPRDAFRLLERYDRGLLTTIERQRLIEEIAIAVLRRCATEPELLLRLLDGSKPPPHQLERNTIGKIGRADG